MTFFVSSILLGCDPSKMAMIDAARIAAQMARFMNIRRGWAMNLRTDNTMNRPMAPINLDATVSPVPMTGEGPQNALVCLGSDGLFEEGFSRAIWGLLGHDLHTPAPAQIRWAASPVSKGQPPVAENLAATGGVLRVTIRKDFERDGSAILMSPPAGVVLNIVPLETGMRQPRPLGSAALVSPCRAPRPHRPAVNDNRIGHAASDDWRMA